MEISIDSIESISLVTANEYNVAQINSIKDKEGALRQMSKAPTFRSDLWRNISHTYE